MAGRDPLQRETGRLPNLRLGFACKERWEDMVGDDRVRACSGCDRLVFNLSAMTREEAEAVLATRGVTPCVRFYRRPDGTVMTTDCPMGARRESRRLAVVASTLAAGTALAGASPARAEPAPVADPAPAAAPAPDPAADPTAPDPKPADDAATKVEVIDHDVLMGVPLPEMGVIIEEPAPRPALEWSIWGRLGAGVASQRPNVLARRLTPPVAGSSPTWEAAVAADLTLRVAASGDVRLGAWGELRTSTDPVAGAELVVEGLPPHPHVGHFDGTGSIVLRAGGNAHVVTGALGVGYVGSWRSYDPWIRWARHVVGFRLVASVNRSLDDPHDWSATLGIEIEPIGAARYLLGVASSP